MTAEASVAHEGEPRDLLVEGCQQVLTDIFAGPDKVHGLWYEPYPVKPSRREEFVTGVKTTVLDRVPHGQKKPLGERNRRIVERYYGLDGAPPLRVIAHLSKEVGVGTDAVKRVLTDTRKKLRPYWNQFGEKGLHSYLQLPPRSIAKELYGEDTDLFKDLPKLVREHFPKIRVEAILSEATRDEISNWFERLAGPEVSKMYAPYRLGLTYAYEVLALDLSHPTTPFFLPDLLREGVTSALNIAQERQEQDEETERETKAKERGLIPQINLLFPELPITPELYDKFGVELSGVVRDTRAHRLIQEKGIKTAKQLMEMSRLELAELFTDTPHVITLIARGFATLISRQVEEIEEGTVLRLFGMGDEVQRRESVKKSQQERAKEIVRQQREKDYTSVLDEITPALQAGCTTVEEVVAFLSENGQTLLGRVPGTLIVDGLVRQVLFEIQKKQDSSNHS